MPGAGVHIVVDRVGGSKVIDAADHDAWHHPSLVGRPCHGDAGALLLARGRVREDGAPAPPAAHPRAEGALEPVRKLVTGRN